MAAVQIGWRSEKTYTGGCDLKHIWVPCGTCWGQRGWWEPDWTFTPCNECLGFGEKLITRPGESK